MKIPKFTLEDLEAAKNDTSIIHVDELSPVIKNLVLEKKRPFFHKTVRMLAEKGLLYKSPEE